MDITRKQLALIHIANSQCGITDEEHLAHCIEFGEGLDEWTASSKYLTYAQASRLLDHLKAAHGFKIKSKRWPRQVHPMKYPQEARGKIVVLMTEDQRGMIEYFSSQIKWRFRDGLVRFTRRMLKKDYPCTIKEASMLIESLKSLIGNQKKKERLEANAENPF